MRKTLFILVIAPVAFQFVTTPIAMGDVGHEITFVNLLEAGSSRSVAVQGDFLFAGLSNYLVVIDVSHPGKPRRVASTRIITTSPLWSVYDIAMSGEYALTADDAGLHIIDVSDPYNPVEIGADETGYALGVAVSGSVAFVTNADGVRAVDISDTKNPIIIGSVATSEWAVKIRVIGGYAFVAGYFGSLIVIDVSNPTSPTEVACYDVGAYSWGLDVQDTLAYLPVEYGTSGMSIIDISIPESPLQIGRYACYNPEDVVVADGYAYLVGTPYLFEVVDVSDPTAPRRAAVIDDTGGFEIVKQGQTVYVADSGSSFRVVDVEDPAVPEVLGRHDFVGRGRCIAFEGSNAFVGEYGGGFTSIDLTEPDDPAFLASIGHSEITSDIHVMGSELFTGNSDWYPDATGGGFSIYDTTDPVDPVPVSTAFSWDNVYDIEADPSYVYGIGNRYGYKFFVYDITDRASPAELAALPISGGPRQCDVAGDVAYVAARSGGLVVLDVSDRQNPAELAMFVGDISDIQVVGRYGFAVEPGSGLVVIDVSNPEHPAEVSRTTGIGTPYFVTVDYPWVITTSYDDNFLRILDASDPASPVLVSQYETGGTGPVAVSDTLLVMVTDGPGSVLILECGLLDKTTGVGDNTPRLLRLGQNYPNPFNPTTTIEYSIAEPGQVSLNVYNVAGQLVRTLVNGYQTPQEIQPVTWSGQNDRGQSVSTGVYFYKLSTRGFTRTRKMLILK